MIEPLSPLAQAVSDAYWTYADLVNREVSHEEMLAAAFCAFVDQYLPEEPKPTGMHPCGDAYSAREEIRRTERMKIRQQLLVTAAELEAQ